MVDPGEEIITVADFTRLLDNAVKRASGPEWVEGEVASLTISPRGHAYFSLKDEREEAVIDCVMYRYQAMRARRWLADGARLQVMGSAMLYAPRGRLQLRAERARPAGRGALLEALERLKKKLETEGLFDEVKRRPLPTDPSVIGVVTSSRGAAFHDIRKVAFGRANVRLVLCAALVQGDRAPQTICRALELLQRYPGLDLIIVGRGGGSGEDLMAFNDEAVVRAVASCRVPIVSAVGHEIDTTLTDLAADVRAATPSQAAELSVPPRNERLETLRTVNRRLWQSMRARIAEDRSVVHRLRSHLGDPRFLLVTRQQHLDELIGKLERHARRRVGVERGRHQALLARLGARHPRVVLSQSRSEIRDLSGRAAAAIRMVLRGHRGVISVRRSQLDALSPLSILSRGYAIATRADGRALRRSTEVAPGDSVAIRLHVGSVEARVERARDADGGGRGKR